ncbi:MAG: hypothetical protein M1822_009211 [Bathelium mastoideum]|nr:MAG: hypothetical protein M1822_009211 [Bathelium mastoideum]
MASSSIKKTFFALAALAASTVANVDINAVKAGVGQAIVENMCSYDVYVTNVPAADGGFTQQTYTLQKNNGNEPYSFSYTQLSNSDGWSIKLSKDPLDLSNIMQFETTFHDDGMIWYDLSDVNGNPWDGNWMIMAKDNPNCSPKHQAYRYSTDDAYGMQACQQNATLTVTLCSGNEDAAGMASSASVSVASESATSQADATSYSTPEAVPTISSPIFSAPVEIASTPSTLQTSTSPTSSASSSSIASPSTSAAAATTTAKVIATVTEIASTVAYVTTTYEASPSQGSKRDVDAAEYVRVHEHIKRHQDARHRHHAHF